MSDTNLTKSEIQLIQKDRMRFTKNKLPANLTLLAILINVFYFVSIYKTNARYFYQPHIGISVVYNLIFMLAAFLSSEGIKNYKPAYGYVLLAIGVLQIVRIFYFPVIAHSTYAAGSEQVLVMGTSQFIRVIVYLVASAVILFSAGIIGIIRSKNLEKYRATIGEEKPA